MGALASWTPKLRILTTQLCTAFQNNQESGAGGEMGRKQKGEMRRKRMGTSKVAWES